LPGREEGRTHLLIHLPVLTAVPDIMNKVQLFQERILADAEQLALAIGAAAYRFG
jgi:hypothetical protein